MNPAVTYLDWKWSSGWLESWEESLLTTDISTIWAEAIFRLDWRWLPQRVSKRQSPKTFLLRTPFTQMIIFNQGHGVSVFSIVPITISYFLCWFTAQLTLAISLTFTSYYISNDLDFPYLFRLLSLQYTFRQLKALCDWWFLNLITILIYYEI